MSDPIPLIRAAVFANLAEVLDRFGESGERVLERAGAHPGWIHADPAAIVPLLPFYRALGLAGAYVDTVGVHIAESHSILSQGAFGRKINGALTLLEAFRYGTSQAATQFSSLNKFWMIEDRGGHAVWACRWGPLPFEGGVMQSELTNLRWMVGIARAAAGPAWKPLALRFCSSKAVLPDLQRIEAFQGVPIQTGQPWGGVCIPRSALGLLMPGARAGPTDSLEHHGESALATDGLVSSLRQLLLSLSSLGTELRIETVSEMIGLHPRTVQRRIAAEGTTFRAVVGEARHLRARELIAGTDMSLTHIAHELGYSDLAHFTHAYRRWAGSAPSAHRRPS